MSLIVASIGFDLFSAYIIKLLINENNKIEKEREHEIKNIIEIKSESDISKIPKDGSRLIKVVRMNRYPTIYREIYCEIIPHYMKNYDQNFESFVNFKLKHYDPFVNFRFNMYKKYFGEYLIKSCKQCQIIGTDDSQYSEEVDGFQLFEYLVTTYIDSVTLPLYNRINWDGKYIIKDTILDNRYLYMNAKINNKTVKYDVIGSKPELVVKKKYEQKEKFVLYTGILIVLAACTSTIFTINKLLKS